MRKNFSIFLFFLLLLLSHTNLLSASNELNSHLSSDKDKKSDEAAFSGAGFSSGIFVEQQTDCMIISNIKQALESVLIGRNEAQYMIITVVVSPTVDGAVAFLRAVERQTGEILLERTLNIAPNECSQAHKVLALMLEQFLTGFPMAKWKEKHLQPDKQSTSEEIKCKQQETTADNTTSINWSVLIGTAFRLPILGGDIEIGTGFDAGTARHRAAGGVVVRAAWPNRLEEGRYLESAALFYLGWRFHPNNKYHMGIDLRTGSLNVSGLGYEKNYSKWLWAVEGQLSVFRKLKRLFLGLEITIAPPLYTATTLSGAEKELSWIRLGIITSIPIGKSVL